MSVDANKAVTQRFYDDLFNRARLAVADELVAVDCRSHAAPPGTPVGPDGMRQAVALLRAAFPDCRYVIEDLIGEDDRMAVRLVFRGTHLGLYRGIPATGRQVVQVQMHVLRLAGGQVAEHWAVRDDLGLLDQLGVAPA
jgi:predicted ester cyclase